MGIRVAAAVVGGLFLVIYSALSWCGAGWLAMPPRRGLSPIHRERLAQMPGHGVRVMSRRTADGTPYLDCEPIPGGQPGDRGRLLRAQLAARPFPVPPFGRITGTIVLLHGWGMRKEDLLFTAERFCAVGFRCLVPDLPGHGDNPRPATNFGSTAAERELPAAVCADAARHRPLAGRPCLWGMSMGAAWAIQSAAIAPARWQRVIAVSPFDALEPVVFARAAAETHAWSTLLEPGLILATRCRSAMWLPAVRPIDGAGRISTPTLIVHGTTDDLIPLAAGRRLFDAVAAPRKRWIEVTNARHGNVLATPQPVFVEMAAWLLTSPESPGSSPPGKSEPRLSSQQTPHSENTECPIMRVRWHPQN